MDIGHGRACEDVQVVDDSAAAEVEEILAGTTVPSTASLPTTNVG